MWLPSGACAYPVQSCCLCLSSNPRTDFFPQRSRECRPEYKHGVQAGRKERQLSSQWQKTVQDLGFQSYHESRPVAKRIAESRRRRATARASKLDLSSNIQRTRKEKRDTSIEDRHAELTERNQEIRMLIGNIAHTKSGDSTMKSLERKKEKRKERQKRKSKSSSSSSSASGRSSGSESSDEEKTKRRNKGGKAQLDPPVTIGHSGDSNGPQVRIGAFKELFAAKFSNVSLFDYPITGKSSSL